MEELHEVRVLDHGYVRLVETWGSEQRIIEAARMSTSSAFKGWGPFDCPECMHESGEGRVKEECSKCNNTGAVPGDERLLAFLWNHRHTSPFEMAGAVFEIQAPIFVLREWHRHRTQSYNEMSARYAPLPAVNYVPTVDRLLEGAAHTKNKQAAVAAGAAQLTEESAANWLAQLSHLYEQAEAVYQAGLKGGVPKELARLAVPVARYSRMRAQAVLLNWFRFVSLRSAPNAQWEIRQYADAILVLLGKFFPRSVELMQANPL